MGHDVYMCYDEKDMEICDALAQVFEDNGIKAWLKSRQQASISKTDITNAISEARCFVLLLTKNSKDKNFVLTESDIAFSRNVPLLVLNVDNSKLNPNLEFILETQTKMYPIADSKKQLELIVEKTSEIIGKRANNIKINSNAVREFEKSNPYRKNNRIMRYVKIAVPILIALILVYFLVILPAGQNTTEDGVFSMNITDVEITETGNAYQYKVYGESYNLPSDSEMYFMNIKFFDNEDNEVFEVNSTADEFKYGIICSCELVDNNITHIGFRLTDLKGKLLSEEDYVIE